MQPLISFTDNLVIYSVKRRLLSFSCSEKTLVPIDTHQLANYPSDEIEVLAEFL